MRPKWEDRHISLLRLDSGRTQLEPATATARGRVIVLSLVHWTWPWHVCRMGGGSVSQCRLEGEEATETTASGLHHSFPFSSLLISYDVVCNCWLMPFLSSTNFSKYSHRLTKHSLYFIPFMVAELLLARSELMISQLPTASLTSSKM